MRDKTHKEQVERWARYCKENPNKWKSKLKPFLDAQIIMARRFYKRLRRSEKGREKIKKLMKKEN